MGIIKTITKSALNTMRSLILDDCLRYEDGDIRVMLVE